MRVSDMSFNYCAITGYATYYSLLCFTFLTAVTFIKMSVVRERKTHGRKKLYMKMKRESGVVISQPAS